MPVSRPRPYIGLLAACLLALTACGGGDDDDAASITTDAPTEQTAAGDETAADDETEEETAAADEETEAPTAPVCELLTDEEIARTVGYEVLSKEANLMALPTCDWHLDVSGEDDPATKMFPLASLTLMPADEYGFRVDPILDLGAPVEGVGDEAYLFFVGDPEAGLANQVQFYALQGDQAFVFLPAISTWENAEAAAADLTELGNLIFSRL